MAGHTKLRNATIVEDRCSAVPERWFRDTRSPLGESNYARPAMFRSATLGAAMLVLATAASQADPMAACRTNASPDEQARACSDVIDQVPSPAPNILATAWAYRAKAYARKGMAKEAADNYSQAVKVAPTLKMAWVGRGMARLLERKFDDAIADFSTAIALEPRDAPTFVARGYAYLAQGKPKLAIADFTKSLSISPEYVAALNNRGLAYRKLGQVKRAISDYSQAILLNPLYALAYNNRGYAFEALGRKTEAIDDFRNALSIDPSLVGARDALVRLKAASSLAAQSTNRVAAGKVIARETCAWCHAIDLRDQSRNKDAPPFRDIHARHPVLALREPISRAVATPHDRMPKLPLTNAEIDQVIAYINSLRPTR